MTPEELHAPLEQALREGHLIPVVLHLGAKPAPASPSCSTSSLKLLPNPTEGNPPAFVKAEGDKTEELRAEPDP